MLNGRENDDNDTGAEVAIRSVRSCSRWVACLCASTGMVVANIADIFGRHRAADAAEEIGFYAANGARVAAIAAERALEHNARINEPGYQDHREIEDAAEVVENALVDGVEVARGSTLVVLSMGFFGITPIRGWSLVWAMGAVDGIANVIELAITSSVRPIAAVMVWLSDLHNITSPEESGAGGVTGELPYDGDGTELSSFNSSLTESDVESQAGVFTGELPYDAISHY